MIRTRFKICEEDFRPVKWPIKHPYWVTGYGDDYTILVAYADDWMEIMENWPEAFDLDSEDVTEYVFTSRFPKPDWMEV